MIMSKINVRENRRDNQEWCNSETLATLGTQSRMANSETLATLGTQSRMVLFRDTGNIGYTIENGAIQRHWQHWVRKKKTTLENITQHRKGNMI